MATDKDLIATYIATAKLDAKLSNARRVRFLKKIAANDSQASILQEILDKDALQTSDVIHVVTAAADETKQELTISPPDIQTDKPISNDSHAPIEHQEMPKEELTNEMQASETMPSLMKEADDILMLPTDTTSESVATITQSEEIPQNKETMESIPETSSPAEPTLIGTLSSPKKEINTIQSKRPKFRRMDSDSSISDLSDLDNDANYYRKKYKKLKRNTRVHFPPPQLQYMYPPPQAYYAPILPPRVDPIASASQEASGLVNRSPAMPAVSRHKSYVSHFLGL
jgi:hypothetical protein